MLPASDYLLVGAREPAVKVEHLTVRYKTRQDARIKHTLTRFRQRTRRNTVVDAVRGISFEVPTGSVYGVIGNNGAGKSTLFRVIAGILPPTGGRVTTYGRVTPLLSLGLGFNRELSGHENILLGGLAQGLEPAEIAAKYDDIIRFADLGDAIHYPMRTYSSGMGGRLGFAIAAHLDPEIVLIDEALAAGDAAFKQKCMAKIIELCEADCTVMIVSHGHQIIKALADFCLWLEHGQVRMEGEAGEVIEAYLENEGVSDSLAAMEDV